MGLGDRDYMRRTTDDLDRANSLDLVRGSSGRNWLKDVGYLFLILIPAALLIRGCNSIFRKPAVVQNVRTSQMTVSASTAATVPQASTSPKPMLVNINTATVEALDSLPYVTPKIAAAIKAGRPFTSVDDLIRVSGIGPKTLERIRPYVTVE